MNNKIIFGLIGIVAGAVILQGHAGWLIGGLLGFLLGAFTDLSARLQGLEHELARLRQEPEPAAPAKPAETAPRPSPKPPPAAQVSVTAETSRQQAPSPAPASARVNPAESRASGFILKLIIRVRNFFTQGNPIVRVGMVVLFFGLSFLVKYASGAGFFPVELRLAVIAAVSIALMIVGWKTRNKQNGYGLILQGGGIAALYLTIFAANKYYELMPAGVAFALMFVVVMLGAMLAVLQNAQVLALMATAGGFLAPILTSDGSGNHVGLFGFYLLLNIGVLVIAWFKTWRLLNWIGFVFTFVITSAWGVLSYKPELYSSTQPFLLAFFALYLAVSVLFSIKQPPKLTGLVDGSLVFGLPMVGFGLQTALLKHTEYGLAISAVILSAVYVTLASVLWKKYQQTHRLLIESFIALGVVFATLAVPLALDADWTSATWAIEAAGLVWVGSRQQRWLPRVAGYGLYLLGAGSIFINDIHAGPVPIITGDFIGLFILSASAFAMAFVLFRNRERIARLEDNMEWMTMVAGLGWWFIAGVMELEQHLPSVRHFVAILFFLALSILGFMAISRKLHWPGLLRSGYSLLPLTFIWLAGNFLWSLFDSTTLHPLRDVGALALLTFAAVQYRFLWNWRDSGKAELLNTWHVLTVWTLLGVLFWEAAWWQQEMNWQGTAELLLWFAVFSVPLVALMAVVHRDRWPFGQYRTAYKDVAPVPLMLFVFLWFVSACTYAGTTWQMHLPVINPLDLAQLAVVLLLAYLIKNNIARLGQAEPAFVIGAPALAGFVWLNVVVLRAVHHYADVNYNHIALWQSETVQMSLSILWTLCALVVMNFSRRRESRNLWILGAVLLGAVVLKLFTKDLTGTGTLARIVSFMVVGGLMLLIGYLSPIPGRATPSTGAGEETG